MESFILWSVAVEDSQLSFLATRIQAPAIQQGSRAMIDEMLRCLDLGAQPYDEWHVRHFRSCYFSDEPPLSAESWADTWEIVLSLAAPVALPAGLMNRKRDIVRTWAHDERWDGSPTPDRASYVVVGDFYNTHLLSRVEAILREGAEPDESELVALAERRRGRIPPRDVAIQRRSSTTDQLWVDCGEYDEPAFEAHGAATADAVMQLMRAYGATPTWSEAFDHWVSLQQR